MKIHHWNSNNRDSSKFLFKRKLRSKRSFGAYAAWFFLFAAVVGAAGFGVWRAVHHPYFRVKTVSLSGMQEISEHDLRETIAQYLSGSTKYFIPRDEMFFISAAGLSARIREAFPKAKDVVVQKKYPAMLSVDVRERDLWGLVCPPDSIPPPALAAEEPVSATGKIIFHDEEKPETFSPEVPKNCLFIDEGGIAFGALDGLGTGVLPTLYVKAGEAVSGVPVLGKNIIDYFKSVHELLEKKLGLTLVGLADTPENPKDYKLIVGGDWYILVSKTDTPAVWVEQVKTLIVKKFDGNTDHISYIDLRFGNKVFYKLKQRL